MSKGRVLVLVCLLALSGLPVNAHGTGHDEPLAFDETDSASSVAMVEALAIEPNFQVQTVFVVTIRVTDNWGATADASVTVKIRPPRGTAELIAALQSAQT